MYRDSDTKIQNIPQKCPFCSKTFADDCAVQTHIKTKHNLYPDPSSYKKKYKPNQPPSSQLIDKIENTQNHIEDQMISFLESLKNKNFQIKEDINSKNEQKQFIIVKNPWKNLMIRRNNEPFFELVQVIDKIQWPQTFMSDELAEVLKQDTILLWNKIGFDSYIWQQVDPNDFLKLYNEEFTIFNTLSVLRNMKSKGVKLKFPQFSVFMVWLAKICQMAPWKQFYIITAYTVGQYHDFVGRFNLKRDKSAWKAFNFGYLLGIDKMFPQNVLKEFNILNSKDIVSFLRLYQKWVAGYRLDRQTKK